MIPVWIRLAPGHEVASRNKGPLDSHNSLLGGLEICLKRGQKLSEKLRLWSTPKLVSTRLKPNIVAVAFFVVKRV